MNTGIKILLAEDDPNLGTVLRAYLNQKGFTVFLAVSGQMTIDFYKAEDIDLCILDIMMPVKDGYTVASEIRKMDKRIPIIFLSAKSQEQDKIKGFEVGADDYITKPFSMDELLLRIQAIIRRSIDETRPENNIFHIGKYIFDYNRQLLTINNIEKKLTSKESELLKMFALNMNQLVDRSATLYKIWKDDSYFNARSMDVYITKLRKYLEEDPYIEIMNVHGVGFKLTVKDSLDN